MGTVGGIGAKLLGKMGWVEGTGLGARRDGRVEPLAVRKRVEKLGVGAERRPFQDAWWERALEHAYGKPSAETNGDGDLLQACEGRRCRPHGSAKLARLERQEKMVGGDTEGKAEEKRERRKLRKARREGKDKKLKVRDGGVKKERKSKKKKSKVKKDEKEDGLGS